MDPEISLAPERPEDDAFLFELYATTRAAEMALTPWTGEQRRAFLRQQYDLRRLHYLRYYPNAEYLLILRCGHPIGRIATHPGEQEIRIIDIALVPDHRAMGIGSELIRELLAQAGSRNKSVTLHVERCNRAVALYQRLGFRVVEDGEIYLFLKWLPESHLQSSLSTQISGRSYAT